MEYGLIGERLGHSYSEQIHNMLGYEYTLREVAKDKLDEFMHKADFKAINVTIPYKEDVISYCATLSDEARKIGSVNTIVKDHDGLLHGYNTDYKGFKYLADINDISFAGKKVLILGNGGTSLTARAVAKDEGASEVICVSRTGEVNYDNIYDHHDADIIVNTTPVGMFPNNNKRLIDLSGFEKCSAVIDVIYNPLLTELVIDAKERGIKHTGGLAMLVAQAIYASELFRSVELDKSIIKDILFKTDRKNRNLVFIGMPGSGKSEIGKNVAQVLGRDFIDTDSLIESQTGRTIPEIFEKYGEAEFRRIESDVVAEVGKKAGKVISVGGGAPVFENNRRNLLQNGFICYIKRNLDELATDNRPLSKDTNVLRELYNKRHPVYCELSDAAIENDGTISQAVEKIVSIWTGEN